MEEVIERKSNKFFKTIKGNSLQEVMNRANDFEISKEEYVQTLIIGEQVILIYYREKIQ